MDEQGQDYDEKIVYSSYKNKLGESNNLMSSIQFLEIENSTNIRKLQTENSSNTNLAYAHGVGSVFWLLSNVNSDYPFSCLCDPAQLANWQTNQIVANNENSPVVCAGVAGGSLLQSAPFCDATFK